jgi:hypothetical protein
LSKALISCRNYSAFGSTVEVSGFVSSPRIKSFKNSGKFIEFFLVDHTDKILAKSWDFSPDLFMELFKENNYLSGVSATITGDQENIFFSMKKISKSNFENKDSDEIYSSLGVKRSACEAKIEKFCQRITSDHGELLVSAIQFVRDGLKCGPFHLQRDFLSASTKTGFFQDGAYRGETIAKLERLSMILVAQATFNKIDNYRRSLILFSTAFFLLGRSLCIEEDGSGGFQTSDFGENIPTSVSAFFLAHTLLPDDTEHLDYILKVLCELYSIFERPNPTPEQTFIKSVCVLDDKWPSVELGSLEKEVVSLVKKENKGPLRSAF